MPRAVLQYGSRPIPQLDATSARWREVLIALILAGCIIAAFAPVTLHRFLTWDDYENVARNTRFDPVSLKNIAWFWRHSYLSMYIPLTYSVWGILALIADTGAPDVSGSRLDPTLFHSTNLVLHILSAYIVYRLLRRLVHHPWAAMAGALLFAIHPVQVEPVAWVTGLKDVLAGLLALVGLWQYVAYAQEFDSGTNEKRSNAAAYVHYSIATFAFILALLAKPSAVVAPAAAAVLDLLVLRRRWLQTAIALTPWLLLSLGCILIARNAQLVNLAHVDGGQIWLRPLLAGDALGFYLYKLALPIWLIPEYDHAARAAIARGWVFWMWTIPAAVATVSLLFRKRSSWAIAAFLVLVAGTLPVLGLVPFSFEELSLVADRYLYLAMLGPALALAFLLAQFRSVRWLGWACAAWLVLLGIRSFFQTFYWNDSRTLALHELDVNPNSVIAYDVMADACLYNGEPQAALEYARRGINRNPADAREYFRLGSVLAALNRPREAIDAIQKGLTIDPHSVPAQENLAGLLAQTGNFQEAMRVSQSILNDHPDDSQAHFNLAVMLSQQHRDDEAIREFQASLQYDPRNPQAHTYLGTLLAEKGKVREALDHFAAALDADPNYEPAKQAMARLAGPGRGR